MTPEKNISIKGKESTMSLQVRMLVYRREHKAQHYMSSQGNLEQKFSSSVCLSLSK